MYLNLESATPVDLLKCIQDYSLSDVYPNIQVALRNYLTLPVTVASCERSFSKLKLTKNLSMISDVSRTFDKPCYFVYRTRNG